VTGIKKKRSVIGWKIRLFGFAASGIPPEM